MVQYGFNYCVGDYSYQAYLCSECGKSLGGLEITLEDDGYKKVKDSLAGLKVCPHCGEPLFPNNIIWFA